jgi:uncharacterized protein (TIGR03437 family)
MKPHFLCFLFASLAFAQAPTAFTINTIIGTGTAGATGDGAAAKDATINFATAMARGTNGTLYIADTFNNRIRSVQSDGVIRTVVGTGTRGFSGDGAAATAALISPPYGVAVDAAGNVYFSDSLNNIVRKVSATGTITKLAGSGVQGFGGDGGNAVDALLNLPTSVAVDAAGNVYVSDTQNHRVRKITTDGKIATVLGTGQPNFSGDGEVGTLATIYHPEGLSLDSAGNLFVADTFNHRIRKMSNTGIVTTVAGNGTTAFRGDGGQAKSASLYYPRGVFVDASGQILIADTFNNRIRMVTENGVIRTIAGNGRFSAVGDGGPATFAEFRFPRAVLGNGAGGYLVLDTDNQRIRQLNPVVQSPAVNRQGIVSSSAFGAFEQGARGAWLEIYGSNLSTDGAREWSSSDFVDGKAPTSLNGTSVTLGDQRAFVSYVSPGQVNVQVPDSLPAGEYDVVVQTNFGASAPTKVTVRDVQPGLFAPTSLRREGRQYAGVILPDGALVSAEKAARPGETVTLYGTGFGSVAPQLAVGEIVRSANAVVLPFEVYFGDKPATVTYAGLAPGTLGLYQFNVVVPQVEAGDAVPLRFSLNGQAGTQMLFTTIAK